MPQPERTAQQINLEDVLWTPIRLRLRMPRVLHFCALRQQTLTTALTTPSQASATLLRAHPRTKTVLTFAGAFRSLVGAFHMRGAPEGG